MTNKRILVVDDEAGVRELYQAELADEGYDVLTCASADEALEALEQEPVDLVTLDIRMPGTNGLELLDKIRNVDLHLPIVICTAYNSYKQDFSVWGADAYVVKSSDLEELKVRIKALPAVISGRRY